MKTRIIKFPHLRLFYSLTSFFQLWNLLLLFGGRDLSRFFDKSGKPIQHKTPSGDWTSAFPPALLKCPQSDVDVYWWNNAEYDCGKITSKERCVKIVNTFTCEFCFIFEQFFLAVDLVLNHFDAIYANWTQQCPANGSSSLQWNKPFMSVFFSNPHLLSPCLSLNKPKPSLSN